MVSMALDGTLFSVLQMSSIILCDSASRLMHSLIFPIICTSLNFLIISEYLNIVYVLLGINV